MQKFPQPFSGKNTAYFQILVNIVDCQMENYKNLYHKAMARNVQYTI